MAKVLIPTPLRQFTGKQDAVSCRREHRGRSAERADRAVSRPAQADLQRRRQAAQLRQRLSERRRHPLPGQGRDAGRRRRHALAGALASPAAPRVAAAGGGGHAFERGNSALQPPPDHPRGRHRRAAEAEGRQGAAGGRRRPGRAARPLPGGGRRRPHRHGGFRRRRFHQPAAAGDPLHQGRGPQEARFGGREDAGHQSARGDRRSTKWR